MKRLLIIFVVVLFSCEEPDDCAGIAGGNAFKDDCGVCSDGTTGIVANSAKDCKGECFGNFESDCAGICNGNAIKDCLGLCNGEAFFDCNGDCVFGGFLDNLGNGSCDYFFPVFNCDEFNCDNGDCGSWNGNVCMAESAIKYDCSISCDDIISITTTDPSIPTYFQWGKYYKAYVGTYYFEYLADEISENVLWSGYYTTYNNEGNEFWPNHCFELVTHSFVGPALYEWSSLFSDCKAYFDSGLISSLQDNNSNVYDIEYEKYQSELARHFEDLEKERNESSKYSVDVSRPELRTFKKIDDPINNSSVIDIDSNPNSIIREGEHYILKYVKKVIKKER